MWLGAISGILIAVTLGIAFCIAFYVGGTKIWGGNGEFIFKGFNCLIAALLILWLSFAMLKFLVPPPTPAPVSSCCLRFTTRFVKEQML